MRANKARDTGPELSLRKELWRIGVRGYRLHLKKVPGRPDIAFIGLRVAVFVHGCFWHRCPNCTKRMPKTNQGFWAEKFQRNVDRDRNKERELMVAGWATLTAWECEIKSDVGRVAAAVQDLVNERRNESDKGR
jgi:DNA mismatch endonuclease, patch repair protein